MSEHDQVGLLPEEALLVQQATSQLLKKVPLLDIFTQIYTRDTRTCAIVIPAWGSNWGSLGFSHYQSNRGS